MLNCNFNCERADMAAGCSEQWDWEFIEWVWNFRREVHPKNVEMLAKCADRVTVVTLTTPAAVAGFIRGLKSGDAT